MSSGEAPSYNHDPAVELAQAESICREWLPFSRDGEAICWVMVEYDRRGAELDELRRQRAAVLGLADQLGGEAEEMLGLLDQSHSVNYDCGQVEAKRDAATRLQAALGVES